MEFMASTKAIIPWLESGDRLTRSEFLRRWEACPEIKHAELLEGIVYVNAAAIRARHHGLPQQIISEWLGHYRQATPKVLVIGSSTIDLGDDDAPEPDAVMFINQTTLGSCHIDEEGYLVGPPELVIEIAASTESKDLGVKKRVYENAGIREYLVWRTVESGVDWFELVDGRYQKKSAHIDGLLKSEVLPGLWLDVEALLRFDVDQMVKQLQPGLQSEDHDSFVKRLVG